MAFPLSFSAKIFSEGALSFPDGFTIEAIGFVLEQSLKGRVL